MVYYSSRVSLTVLCLVFTLSQPLLFCFSSPLAVKKIADDILWTTDDVNGVPSTNINITEHQDPGCSPSFSS